MGANRPGVKRRKRLKRAKRHNERLMRKAAAEVNKGVLTKVKDAVVHAAEAVADAVRGKKK